MKFNEIIKNMDILSAIEDLGFEKLTDIQSQIIPLIVDGNDVIGQSNTGTGKTLAFIAPILENIEKNNTTQSIILAPTRELAIQIARDAEKLAKYCSVSITCVYGSSSIEEQIKLLKKGSEIVIGTPGRVKDLIKRRVLKLSEIKYFVLDEADEMLSMGFQEEIEYIFEKTNNDRQVLLFSATMPKAILKIAQNYMSPEYKTVSIISEEKTAEHITQNYYTVTDSTRLESMCRLMDYYNPKKAIIFCRTKRNADELFEKLNKRNYHSAVIHGDITQAQRIITLDKFKNGDFNYLIATDVAARGIHVDDVEIVFNYNLPESNEAYIHRIGRTGRASKYGLAITFIKIKEESILVQLEKYIHKVIVQKELPTVNEIINNRANDFNNDLDILKTKECKLDIFDDYLDNISLEESKNIIKNLLNQRLMNNFGSDFSVDLTAKAKNKKQEIKRNEKDSTRVFVTIGKMDKITKREFLEFIEKNADVKEGTCSGVEILSKFTFMNVKNDSLNKVLESCNNVKYNGRVIRIEKAKK